MARCRAWRIVGAMPSTRVVPRRVRRTRLPPRPNGVPLPHAGTRIDRRPARSARRWPPQHAVRTVSRTGEREEVVRSGLILAGAVFAVLVVLPLLIALAASPYR